MDEHDPILRPGVLRPGTRRFTRRVAVKSGLATLAAALMTPVTSACDGDGAMDAGFSPDAGPVDAGPLVDAGPVMFPVREVPELPALRSLIADIGDLGEADENGLRLPPGFTSRIIARTGQPVIEGGYRWHSNPDGGATFITEDSGWIYVSNAELPIIGGAGAIRFDSDGAIIDAYRILDETQINCAGGLTPWHTWLSCEESASGQVYECDPWGEVDAVVRPALGTFKHEAVAVDPDNGDLYLTEDESDGRFYRFVPDAMDARGNPDLSAGTLEVAAVDAAGDVTWLAVPDPLGTTTATKNQVAESTAFRGGEGIWWHAGVIYFSTKGDNHVRAYHIDDATMEVIYDGSSSLTGVDNVTVSCCGDVLVAEDGGDMEIVAVLPSGELKPIVQVMGHDRSEVTGPAFDPNGTRLYFSSQRGTNGNGFTYEVTGPFHELAD